ncbi:MAG: signal peptidase I [Oscillospiraceae bacterium]|nr:signal peptidase I [Oscillospiraceae bacterium]
MADMTTGAMRPQKKGGKFIPALCNIIGTLILIAVILFVLPMALPRILGYEAFNVVSGSMEPEIPEGSLVIVEDANAREVETDQVIAFMKNGTIVIHRVVQNRYYYEEFVTKGDANEQEDIEPVPYSDFLGTVKWHVPYVGNFMMLYGGSVGKMYLLAFALCGVLFNVLAGRLRAQAEERYQRELARYRRKLAEQKREEQKRAERRKVQS